MRISKILLTAVLLSSVEAFSAENVAPVLGSDVQINAAIAKSRDTLPEFLKMKEMPPAGASMFTVKVMFKTGSRPEHMWVSPFRPSGTQYEGILKSHPEFAPNLVFGQRVTFSREQVTDWGYIKDGKRIGYRTTCVFLTRDSNLREKLRREGVEYECAP